jgi:hypothetical protein
MLEHTSPYTRTLDQLSSVEAESVAARRAGAGIQTSIVGRWAPPQIHRVFHGPVARTSPDESLAVRFSKRTIHSPVQDVERENDTYGRLSLDVSPKFGSKGDS